MNAFIDAPATLVLCSVHQSTIELEDAMFTVTQEEMYAMHADRQREVARIIVEQTLTEAPVVRTWMAMQVARIAAAISRRPSMARRPGVRGRQLV